MSYNQNDSESENMTGASLLSWSGFVIAAFITAVLVLISAVRGINTMSMVPLALVPFLFAIGMQELHRNRFRV